MNGSSGPDFIRRQDDEIKEYHARFKEAAQKFVSSRARVSGKVDLFYSMHEEGTSYYRKVEHEILNRDSLSGEEFERWVLEWTATAEKLVHGICDYHQLLREHRTPLGLAADVFEPTPGTYRNIQAFFAKVFPDEAPKLRQKFLSLSLPAEGFDRPYMPKPWRSNSKWWHPLVSVLIVGALFFMFVVGSQHVNPVLMILILTAVIVLVVIIHAVDLRKNEQLAEKSFVDLMKLALTKWISFAISWKSKSK